MTDGDAAVGDSAQFRPQRRYRQSRWRRPENAVMGLLVGAGLVPHSYLLTTRGRRTGQTRRNPVVLVEGDGRRWLVAPYGPVSWVHNARAAGQVHLTRRGRPSPTPSARCPGTRPARCSSGTSTSLRRPGGTFTRTKTTRWTGSLPRPSTTRCSSSPPSAPTLRPHLGNGWAAGDCALQADSHAAARSGGR